MFLPSSLYLIIVKAPYNVKKVGHFVIHLGVLNIVISLSVFLPHSLHMYTSTLVRTHASVETQTYITSTTRGLPSKVAYLDKVEENTHPGIISFAYCFFACFFAAVILPIMCQSYEGLR